MTDSKELKSVFNLQKVKCAGCVNKIQTKLAQLPEVASAQVNLLDKTLIVEYQGATKEDALIIQLVTEIGYGANLDKIEEGKINLWLTVLLPIISSILLMIITMQNHVMIDYRNANGFLLGLMYAVISLVITLFSGYKPLLSGLKGFIHRSLNMYSLVLLGVASAWLYSVWVVLLVHYSSYIGNTHVYFDSALMIIGVINFGSYLEDKAKNTATTAIRSLTELVPDTAQVILNDVETTIATNLLRTDYLVRIKAGDKIPADGVITSGNGLINESMLSGESMPIAKQLGDKVVGGSINTNGSFVFKITAIGEDTFLSHMIGLIKNASLSKPKLVNFADKLVKIFVPLVILIALTSSVSWYFIASKNQLYYAISVFMSVLLIACPCSIGLAIPVSLVVGVGRGAKQGILIQEASCLSEIDKLGVILLDKTGTITEGIPQVINVVIDANYTVEKNSLMKIIAGIEAHSNHPLAKTIVDYCDIKNSSDLDVAHFESIDGLGVHAIIDNDSWYIGSKKFMHTLHLPSSGILLDNDCSQVYVACKNLLVARFDIADKIKSDSRVAIAKLKSLGTQVYMVTGDNEQVAHKIAQEVGITQVVANCMPQDKLDLVHKLQAQGLKVVFIGDGINDAPSLATANIGIAIGGGLDIAKQSAAISLVGSSLSSVYDALILAHDIQLNMRQNLYGSFAYNFIAILIAAGLFYPIFGVMLSPMIASIAMSMSSICVILNALRLRFLK